MKKYYTFEDKDWSQVANASFNAHSGKKLTDDHKKKIAQTLLERGMGKKYVIQAVNVQDHRVKYFENGQEASEFLNCSRQLISQVLSDKERNSHQHSAKGWILTRIYIEEEKEKANED